MQKFGGYTSAVGAGIGTGVGAGIGTGVGAGIGAGVGAGIGTDVGAGIGTGVGDGATQVVGDVATQFDVVRPHGPLPLPHTEVQQNWFVPLLTMLQIHEGPESHKYDGAAPVKLLPYRRL